VRKQQIEKIQTGFFLTVRSKNDMIVADASKRAVRPKQRLSVETLTEIARTRKLVIYWRLAIDESRALVRFGEISDALEAVFGRYVATSHMGQRARTSPNMATNTEDRHGRCQRRFGFGRYSFGINNPECGSLPLPKVVNPYSSRLNLLKGAK